MHSGPSKVVINYGFIQLSVLQGNVRQPNTVGAISFLIHALVSLSIRS